MARSRIWFWWILKLHLLRISFLCGLRWKFVNLYKIVLGLEMIWKLSFNSKRYPDKVTLVLDMNPMKMCVKALSSLSLYKQIRLLGMWHMLMRAMVIMSTKSKISPLNWTLLILYKHCILGWKIPIMSDVQLWRNNWHNVFEETMQFTL